VSGDFGDCCHSENPEHFCQQNMSLADLAAKAPDLELASNFYHRFIPVGVKARLKLF